MLKGCQKRVIWVRNTDSKWFDEAYFILSENTLNEKKAPSESDMLREANRIIAQSPFSGYYGFSRAPAKKNRKFSLFNKFIWFFLGVALSAICTALIVNLL